MTQASAGCSSRNLAVSLVRYRGLGIALERKLAALGGLEHSAVSGAKADRALVLGNADVEFDGFAVCWFRTIMCVFGTGLRPCSIRAPAGSRRPHHEVVERKAKAAVGVCTFGVYAPQPKLAADGHARHVACWRKRRARRARC